MDEPIWDDEARDELRERIRSVVLGELRLAKNGRSDIIQTCREVYLPDECPEDERDSFLDFAEEEFDRLADSLSAEAAGWPVETDCDRLDRVEAKLWERGVLLWQASPCCDSCTSSEILDRIAEVGRRRPEPADGVRGFAFFIDQNLPESLAEGTRLDLFLGYGWISPDGVAADPPDYQRNAIGIAQEVCEVLRFEGFEPDWGGDIASKIGVAVNWQRRSPLE
ncbi:DUF6891 domain-containing protein [Paludisphaera soli]|uniref:DUF6891 domain-containing protein n=1 Tax=Paludisphaera soli TaxID=2712865 RepID=UPI0013EB0BFB|nr:hypothetical protein [Paludisphaera soli]